MKSPLLRTLQRIRSVGSQTHPASDQRSLLHAYAACLSLSDVCAAIRITINDAPAIRRALRSRLLRLLRYEHSDYAKALLVKLVEQTVHIATVDKALRVRIDALHSAVFEYLPSPAKQMVLERWMECGTRGAANRWLKATKIDPDLFDSKIALALWRSSKNAQAAKMLAYQAQPEMLAQIIPELIEDCEEGWIISKAVLRAGTMDEALWAGIQRKHPATYLYLCAQTGRQVSEQKAFELVCRCDALAIDGGRSLAIWAVGQMGMLPVLDRIRRLAEPLHETNIAERIANSVCVPSLPLTGRVAAR